MKAYLVEAYRPDIEFDEDSTIIALTPEVCYQLDKAGIKYSTIESYYDEVELSASADEYYESQLQWIGSLDEFLQKNIAELKESNLKLGTIYFLFLKTMLLDPLYIRCHTLNRLFEAIKPSSITFVSHPSKETPLDFSLQSSGRSYYSQVIPILCSDRNIPLTSVLLEPGGEASEAVESVRGIRALMCWLTGKLYRSETARSLYFTYKYFSKRSFPKQKSRERLNILILKLAHMGMDFVFDAFKRGHNVYRLSDNSMLKYSPLGAKKCFHIKKDTVTDFKIWENAASLLEGHDLIKRLNGNYQLDISEIVLPKLKYFVSEVCPETFGYFKVFIDFYKKAGIDLVVTPHEVSPVEFAAIAAANYREHIKTVCISHGDAVFNVKFWRVFELSHDILISASLEEKEYYRYLCQTNNLTTRLYSSPDRLLAMEEIRRSRESGKGNIKRNRIIYLPTFMMWDARRMEGDSYPDTWYYQFQKSLIEYFSTKREYLFVWKGLPPSGEVYNIYNPIPDFIKDNRFSNIEVATNPFPQHLLSADRVICDFPSTGFYESVIAGVPTMSLYHKALIVRKSAVDYFGNLLKPFSDSREAIKHIEEFLNSEAELYRATVDVEDSHILDILEEVGKNANR